jgi:hypothetical protein
MRPLSDRSFSLQGLIVEGLGCARFFRIILPGAKRRRGDYSRKPAGLDLAQPSKPATTFAPKMKMTGAAFDKYSRLFQRYATGICLIQSRFLQSL